MVTKKHRYFLYSREQYTERCNIESTIGMKFIPGKVLKSGRWREFTELSATPTSSTYLDAQIIAEGNLDDMRYELPKRERKTR